MQPWNLGDSVALVIGVIVTGLGFALQPVNRNRNRFPLVFANGMTLGTLFLIIASPLAQLFKVPINFLEVALNEGRIPVYWAVVYVAAFIWLDIFKPGPEAGAPSHGPAPAVPATPTTPLAGGTP